MSPSVVESLPTAEPGSFSGTVEPLKVISLGAELLGGAFGSLEDDPPPPPHPASTRGKTPNKNHLIRDVGIPGLQTSLRALYYPEIITKRQ